MCIRSQKEGCILLHSIFRIIMPPDGIRCNWVTVGWVMSEGEKSRLLNTGMTEEDIAAQAKKEIPMGQFQTAEDIANACVYLLSDEAMQVTGTDIKVTGGFLSVSRIG